MLFKITPQISSSCLYEEMKASKIYSRVQWLDSDAGSDKGH